MDKSFNAFFRRLGQGDKPGFPRFKGRDRFHSLEYRHGDGCKLREQDGRPRFYVQNVGEIKIKMHRPLPEGAKLGHVILKRRVGRWYVCFAVELPDAEPVPNHGPAVGIDVGLKSLLALSDGTLYDNPRRLRTGSHPGRAQLVHGEAIWTGVPSRGGCRRASTHSLRSTGRWR